MKKSKNAISKSIITWVLITMVSVFALSGCNIGSDVYYELEIFTGPDPDAGTVEVSTGDSGYYYFTVDIIEDTEVQIRAVPYENWVFDRWSDDITGTQNPANFKMVSDKTIHARFVRRDYPLTINIEGEGAVEETIVQPKSTDYQFGTNVQLEAVPATGWMFGEWKGDIQSIDNPETITIDGPVSVTAVFDQVEFSIQARADGPGTASVDPQKDVYDVGETVTFIAVPNNANIEFIGWFNDMDDSLVSQEAMFEHQVMSDITYTAYFRTVPDAVVVETASISVTDGKVNAIVFNIYNYLLNNIVLNGVVVENGNSEEIANLSFPDPKPNVPSRTGGEINIGFDEEDAPNEEVVKDWIITLVFNYLGVSYEKKHQVGEPASDIKQKQIPLKNIEVRKLISVEIE